jgi:hypothetical protein
VDPLWLIGLEGCFALVLSALTVPFLALAPCPFNLKACVFNSDGEAVV